MRITVEAKLLYRCIGLFLQIYRALLRIYRAHFANTWGSCVDT